MPARTPRVQWFSKETRRKIQEEAVAVLEEIGVLVEHEEAVSLLADAGAHVVGGGGESASRRVRIRGEMIDRALQTAPRRIRLYDRAGRVAMDLGKDRLHFNPGSAALRIYDHREKRARAATTYDLVQLAALTDALPSYAAQSTGLISGDVAREIGDVYRLYIALLCSRKPVVTGTFRPESFRIMQDMLSAVAGGDEKLRSKPLAIFDCCPSPPLKWSRLTCQALIDCARSGLPAELVSMPLTGATAPVTLVGAVVQQCAENLSGVVVHQLARAGSPIIYGGSPACFDMRKGTTPMGAIETLMIDGAAAEMARHIGLPSHAYMALSDAKLVDYQAGMESALGALVGAISGVNNVSGPGMLDFESCQSLEKLVLDHEVCAMALRMRRGLEPREERLAVPVIEEGIERGDFLGLAHTLRWFREEAYMPDAVIDRDALEEWQAKGASDAVSRAAGRVRSLLETHPVEPLGEDVAREITHRMEHEARRCGMEHLPDLPLESRD